MFRSSSCQPSNMADRFQKSTSLSQRKSEAHKVWVSRGTAENQETQGSMLQPWWFTRFYRDLNDQDCFGRCLTVGPLKWPNFYWSQCYTCGHKRGENKAYKEFLASFHCLNLDWYVPLLHLLQWRNKSRAVRFSCSRCRKLRVWRDQPEPRQLREEAATGRAVTMTFMLGLTRNSSPKKADN